MNHEFIHLNLYVICDMFTYKMTFRGQILRRMDLLTGEITERESLYTKPEFSTYLVSTV